MKQRGMSEEEAFSALRSLAMQRGIRLGEAAIDNRGQERDDRTQAREKPEHRDGAGRRGLPRHAYLAADTRSRISATALRAASVATGSYAVCGSLSTHESL
jgi:hypothetical protein